jgi:hypothetical protein
MRGERGGDCAREGLPDGGGAGGGVWAAIARSGEGEGERTREGDPREIVLSESGEPGRIAWMVELRMLVGGLAVREVVSAIASEKAGEERGRGGEMCGVEGAGGPESEEKRVFASVVESVASAPKRLEDAAAGPEE